MSYAPIDDRFGDHPKHVELSLAHLGLIAYGIAYATLHLTNGVLPASLPGRRGGAQGSQLATSLVARGLWERRSDGSFLIVGFLDHNPSRDEVLAKRRMKSESGRRGGIRSGEVRSEAKEEAKLKQTRSKCLDVASTESKLSSLHFTALHREGERDPRARDPLPDVIQDPESGTLRVAMPIAAPPETEVRLVVAADPPRYASLSNAPKTIVITQEILDTCAMAGAPVPSEADVIACLANAQKKGHVFADWNAELVSWMCKVKRFSRPPLAFTDAPSDAPSRRRIARLPTPKEAHRG